MKTPIQELIDWIEKNSKMDVLEAYAFGFLCEHLINKEETAIISAYAQGMNNADSVEDNLCFVTGKQYYNQTFKL